MRELDRQLEQGRNDCAAIQYRYEEQIRAMEGTRSELLATNRFIKMLEAQKLVVQNDLDQLQGLLHPIRRCPSDILQHVFEWTLEMPEKTWFNAATALSHVCQRWREVTLRTPNLWTCTIVSLDRKPEDIEAFWERTVQRVKSVPVSIVIRDINGVDAQRKAFGKCRFTSFPHIKHLELHIHDTNEDSWFTYAQIQLPSSPVEHLDIIYHNVGVDGFIDIYELVNGFLPIPSLSFTSRYLGISFTEGLTISSVTALRINKVYELSFGLLAQAFPNAEVVDFEAVTFSTQSAGSINWLRLHLYRFVERSIPLGLVSMPQTLLR